MNALTTNKIRKALQLFVGMRQPRVRDALQPFGFNPGTMSEGLRLLQAAARTRMVGTITEPEEPALLERIDAFENTWFPLVRAVLTRAYPEIAQHLFLNLTQQQGREAALSVGVFLERLANMAEGNAPYGADGAAARKLLSERGLTPEREAAAQGLIDELTLIKDAPPGIPSSAEEQAAADEALAGWYREWSAIARVAISDKRVLRTLGLARRRANAGDEATDTGESDGSETPLLGAAADVTPRPQLTAPEAAE